MRKIVCGVLALAGGIACSSDATAPSDVCPATTGSVTATVTTGGSVVFDWDPACAVAMLLVEEGSADQWVIFDPGIDDSLTEALNIIVPPVTYGQVPAGAVQNDPPLTLAAGTTYELVLWKILPLSSTVQCEQRNQNACLLAVHEFQR